MRLFLAAAAVSMFPASAALISPASALPAAPDQQNLQCATVGKADDPQIATLLGLLGITPPSSDAGVGLNCSPAGLGGEANFCGDTNLNGLVAFGKPGACTTP